MVGNGFIRNVYVQNPTSPGNLPGPTNPFNVPTCQPYAYAANQLAKKWDGNVGITLLQTNLYQTNQNPFPVLRQTYARNVVQIIGGTPLALPNQQP